MASGESESVRSLAAAFCQPKSKMDTRQSVD